MNNSLDLREQKGSRKGDAEEKVKQMSANPVKLSKEFVGG